MVSRSTVNGGAISKPTDHGAADNTHAGWVNIDPSCLRISTLDLLAAGWQLIVEPLRIMIFTGAAMSGPFMHDRCVLSSCEMIGNKHPSSLECLHELESIQLSQRPSAADDNSAQIDPFRRGRKLRRKSIRPSVYEDTMLLRNDRLTPVSDN